MPSNLKTVFHNQNQKFLQNSKPISTQKYTHRLFKANMLGYFL